jgi:hypothetical protein
MTIRPEEFAQLLQQEPLTEQVHAVLESGNFQTPSDCPAPQDGEVFLDLCTAYERALLTALEQRMNSHNAMVNQFTNQQLYSGPEEFRDDFVHLYKYNRDCFDVLEKLYRMSIDSRFYDHPDSTDVYAVHEDETGQLSVYALPEQEPDEDELAGQRVDSALAAMLLSALGGARG